MASSIEKKLLKFLETLILNQTMDERSTLHHAHKKDNVTIHDVGQNRAKDPYVDVPVKSATSQKSNVDDGDVVSSLMEHGESSKQDEGYKKNYFFFFNFFQVFIFFLFNKCFFYYQMTSTRTLCLIV